MSALPLLRVEDLRVAFRTHQGEMTVLYEVSFDVAAGETLCLVGESGSGKSMTALALMGLVPQPNGAIRGGSIRLEGEELIGASQSRLRRMRGKEISMIFQEPMTALNPVFTIGEQIAETLRVHEGLDRKEALARAAHMLRAVRHPLARATPARLFAPAVGRHASARHDRDGACLSSENPDRR